MDTIQIALFFLVSYLLSRVFVVLKIPELVVYYLFERKHISIQKLSLILILGSALISTVIANMVTVLTLMPLVNLLQKEFKGEPKFVLKLNTLFLLCVLWGANIGGIGMVTGTTTNGILIGLYEINRVPVASSFTFISWAVWGLPLTTALALLGWLVLMVFFRPGNLMHKADFSREIGGAGLSRKLQKTGFLLALAFLISAGILSYLLSVFEEHTITIIGITYAWLCAFVYLIMLHGWRSEDGERRQLLKTNETLQDIPKWGLFWVGLAILVSYLLWWKGFFKVVEKLGTDWLSYGRSDLQMYLIIALLITFVSEVLSNTAILVTMVTVLFPIMKSDPGLISWEGMLIIALCSSCAFMTPLATPSNGLGYGASRKISLKYMLISGFVMNVLCSTVIVLWVHNIVPLVLSLFT